MISLNYFLRKCPNFPQISVDERKEIQQELRLELRRLTALKRLAQHYRRHEDNLALLHFDFIQAFQSIESDSETHFFSCKALQEDTPTMHLLWFDTIQHFLIASDTKKTSIYYLVQFRNLFSEPSSFSALIITLLQNEITPRQIILSRILHNYFDYKIVNIEEIQATYAHIQQYKEVAEVNELIEMAKLTHCGLASFPDTNLIGDNHCVILNSLATNPIQIDINPEITRHSPLIFQNYQHIFGQEFIFFALTLKNYHEEHQLSEMITHWINGLSLKSLEDLFRDIQHQYHQSLQFNLFKNLCPSLNPAQARHLFNQSDFFWIIIATSPALFSTYTKGTLRELILQEAIMLKDIDYIHALCHNKKFSKQQEYLYKKIFELHLSHQELPHESELCDELFHYAKSREWVEEASGRILKSLRQEILNNLQEFDSDSFINIRDFYYEQRFKVEFLHSQGAELRNYPMDFYSFTSLILELIFQKKAIIQLDDILAAMVPHQASDNEEKRGMMLRIALESLKKTQNNRQILTILLAFKNHFGYSLEKIFEVVDTQNLKLLEMALANKPSLELTLKLLPEHLWLRFLNQRVAPRFENALVIILQSSVLLTTLIEESSDRWLIMFLEKIYKKKTLFWFSLSLESSVYEALFRKFSSDQKIRLLSLSSHDNNNILHYVIAKKELLKIIFQHTPSVLRFILIQQKNDDLDSPLFLSLNHPESLAVIIENIPLHLHQNMMLEHQKDGNNTFQLAIKNIDLLEVLHQHLDEANWLTLINLHFLEIINLYANRPDILNFLFVNIPSLALYELFIEHEHQALKKISSFPDSFFCILEMLNAEERIKLLNLSGILMPIHSVFYNFIMHRPNRVEGLLTLLSAQQTLIFLRQDVVFEYVLQNQAIAVSFFKKLTPIYQSQLIQIVTSKQETWQELISLNQSTILNLFLPLISEREALLYQPIFYRALNHPQSLSIFFSLIPEEKRLSFIQSHETPLFYQLKEPGSIISTLKLLAVQEHIIFLQEKHRTNQHLLGFILTQHQHLVTLIKLLTPYNLYLLIRKITNHHLPTLSFLAQEQNLVSIMQTLPSLTTIQFLKELCAQHAERLVSTPNRIIFLKYLLNQGQVTTCNFRTLSPAEKNHFLYSIKHHGEYLPHLLDLEARVSALPILTQTILFSSSSLKVI